MPSVTCLDLEGVLTPEVWISVAEKTGIEKLRLTTRDISDYDELMRMRLGLLDQNGLKLADIQAVIRTLEPLEGAKEFLDRLRSLCQVIILSDTYYEFAGPLMEMLGRPVLFCNSLVIDAAGRVADYRLRQKDGKRMAVKALHSLKFKVVAAGDSYNDTAMLGEADAGILFQPPDKVISQFPQFPVTRTYVELLSEIEKNLD
ncbi:MAG: phosphoserine phosphatase [Candidatus Glassbacteria bacterium RIFCSPLOWO2_12_FULL_58_11]|uniref:phosphoserine phosphatase n=2 Tax=Candidatus Glassiibacteriota TaxID=1817805 RepID=A0A1F5YSY7_9BACT|nr:MAG: phosphoserine phosphatase [Candidatus Glassbacteria bacterium GWA2_58_10]OGG03224.1 MAG: phosphoserine phosphatase [Candidatus Glassbacteria bacterium RIFCSPLOWO2_12_FULL_58_11]